MRKLDIINGHKVAIYDIGEKSFDRFTAVFVGEGKNRNGFYDCLGMSGDPFHPQGFGQHGDCQRGRHLGKRITFKDLPEPCQKAVIQDCQPPIA